MNIIICLDDRGGMTFLKKRQSKDEAVCKDIIKDTENHNLFVTEYSKKLFPENTVTVSANPMIFASEGDYCFIEREDIIPYLHTAESLIIYRWNRLYPADKNFDISPEDFGLFLKEKTEFSGKSHEKITKEIYTR